MRARMNPVQPFTAVLMAGGRSTRMGFDKAGVPILGQPLWEVQLAKLRALDPAQILVSGRLDGPYAQANLEIVPDAVPDLGPLAGIAATLRRSTSPLVLVLAIDLPDISVAFLRGLVAEAVVRGKGIVPRSALGFEPLAAVYPRTALALAEESLTNADRSLQSFVRSLIAAEMVSASDLERPQCSELRNFNTPADL